MAAEISPLAKTGGLADVVAALGRALHRQGHDVRLFLPLYGDVAGGDNKLTPVKELQGFGIRYPGQVHVCGVSTAVLANSARSDGASLTVELIDCPEIFHRGRYYTSDHDEPLRWATFCRGVLDVLTLSGWWPDIVHCNDWHTGLIPLYLRTSYQGVESLGPTRTLFSIHNLAFQGTFDADTVEQLGLESRRHLFHQQRLAGGQISFLETGILYADWLSTVSETYAGEIQGPEYGMGMEELLAARADHLVGIVNGIDPDEWGPEGDNLIPHRYRAEDMSGKARCKQALLRRFNIFGTDGAAAAEEIPLFGIVSRLTAQKGFELLFEILPSLLQRRSIGLVVLGSGEQRYERYFQALRDAFPDQVAVYFGFDNELAHWIEAGADVFLMPSRYEPCGLNQMFSLSYGTVPLVRRTGGLADTVQQWHGATRTGTGFVFDDFAVAALATTIDEALEVWADRHAWATLVQNGMAQDFSWERQSAHYVDLYHRILES